MAEGVKKKKEERMRLYKERGAHETKISKISKADIIKSAHEVSQVVNDSRQKIIIINNKLEKLKKK